MLYYYYYRYSDWKFALEVENFQNWIKFHPIKGYITLSASHYFIYWYSVDLYLGGFEEVYGKNMLYNYIYLEYMVLNYFFKFLYSLSL